MILIIDGRKVIHIHNEGKPYEERNDYCECDDPHKALGLILRARHLNDVRRKYTASARLFAEVEQLPGFRWLAA